MSEETSFRWLEKKKVGQLKIGNAEIVFIKLEGVKASEIGGTVAVQPATGVGVGMERKTGEISDYLILVNSSGETMPYNVWEGIKEQAVNKITNISGNVGNVSVAYLPPSSLENV
jgi:endo-1,4-beta-mannosidase